MFEKRWLCIAAVLLGMCAGWSWISQSFVYGQGHTERPILSFLALYLVGWLAFGAAWILIRTGDYPSLKLVLWVAILARLALIPSELIQENDVYRYVLDGQVLLNGGNPYEYPPIAITEEGNEAIRESLRGEDAQLVLGRVGYPEIPTIYPPVAQLSFALGSLVGGWDWRGQRWVYLALDLIAILLIIRLLRKLELPSGWVLLFAWNPLVLKEVGNSAHLDILVVPFLVLIGFELYKCQRASALRNILLTAVFLAAAGLSKLYPLILIPACALWIKRRNKDVRHAALFCLLTVVFFLLGIVPFLGIGLENLTSGLTVFAQKWRMNEGFFSLISFLSDQPRLWTSILIGVVATVVPTIRKSTNVQGLMGDFVFVLLFWFLLIPTGFPWYSVPLIALSVFIADQRVILTLVLVSGLTSAYYLHFYIEYHDLPVNWWVLVRVFEHSIIWFSLLWSLSFRSAVEKH